MAGEWLVLRRATDADSDYFLALRNDPTAVAMSASQERIEAAVHAAWFAWALTSPGLRCYVATAGGVAVGTGRIDMRRRPAEVSLVVAPEQRGRGYGSALVRALIDEAARLGLVALEAHVRLENAPSLAAFRRNGFEADPVRFTRGAR